jgi:ParB-like chromosome segregation protein Spo0J
MATTIQETGRRVALGEIRVPENVRELDAVHVKALAGSIELQGMLVPVVVRDGGRRLRARRGFHRIAAAKTLGLTDVPVVVRDVDCGRGSGGREHRAQAAECLRRGQGGTSDA